MSYFHAENPLVLLCYAGLGVILGGASAGYIKSVYGAEDFFERHLKNYYTRHAIGMLLVGIIMYLFAAKGGHYYVEGIGYATVQDVLAGVLSQPYFLALLFLSKALVTSVTLGSGGSGAYSRPHSTSVRHWEGHSGSSFMCSFQLSRSRHPPSR